MISPNNDHLIAHDTYESVRDTFDLHLQRQWDKVLRATRRSAFAAAYDTIVNADPSADHQKSSARRIGQLWKSTKPPLARCATSLPTIPTTYPDDDVPDDDVPDDPPDDV